MSQLDVVCLSLAPNLRCVGFTIGQFAALLIPPAIEVIIALLFIYLCSAPGRPEQLLLAADAILYFIWTLLDVLSRILSPEQTSLSLLGALDYFVGAVSFSPILIYSTYLYRLSFRSFIPTLLPKLQLYPELFLPILLIIAIAINEVSSFVGAYLGTTSNQSQVVQFSDDNEYLWLSLSRVSLTIYALIQVLFSLLALSRLSRAFQDQERIELAHADERHYFKGMSWITVGIIIGVSETITGFAQASFGVALARRILRLIARAVLMFGLLKGPDVGENSESLTGELRGAPRFGNRISRIFGVSRERNMFRRISQPCSEQSQTDECPTGEKRAKEQRVTVHYEQGQAPSLQIRFSVLDFPTQPITDTAQQRRRSLPGLIPGAGTSSQAHRDDISTAGRRTKSLIANGDDHYTSPDHIQQPERPRIRQESSGAVSDSLSIVRDLERKFPNLPPRVTGKYRGSILGENYEEDPFPVVGVSRQSSLRQDGSPQSPSEEGAITLASSGSIKRKPAPPLLKDIAYISERRNRPTSTWGGLTSGSPLTPNTPRRSATYTAGAGDLSTARPRRMTARDVIRRASRALSDASIRSAEWLASASSSRSAEPTLTAMDIEMYRRGTLGPGFTRLPSSAEDTAVGRVSTEDARVHSRPNQGRASMGL